MGFLDESMLYQVKVTLKLALTKMSTFHGVMLKPHDSWKEKGHSRNQG